MNRRSFRGHEGERRVEDVVDEQNAGESSNNNSGSSSSSSSSNRSNRSSGSKSVIFRTTERDSGDMVI